MGLLGSIFGAVGSIAGGLLGAHSSKSAAAQQHDWQIEVLKNRNQWQVEDLKKAGLNPILSAKTPSSAQVSGSDAGSGAPYLSSALSNSARAFLEWSKAESEINLLDQQAKTQEISQHQLASSAKQQDAQTRFIQEQTRGVKRQQDFQDKNPDLYAQKQVSESGSGLAGQLLEGASMLKNTIDSLFGNSARKK